MTTTEAALREARQRLNEYEQMQDAQSQCAPCKLCRGKAIITDAGPGAGYYIRCENSGAFRAAAGCMVSDQRLGGWAYNVMDWWNRLHSQPSPASSTAQEAAIEAAFRAIAGDEADPHMCPEAWEHAETVALAVLSSLSPSSGEPVKRIEDGHADTEGEAAEAWAHLNCPTCGGSGHIEDAHGKVSGEPASVAGEAEDPCPVCGNEVRGHGGYLQCECPAPASPPLAAKPWYETDAHRDLSRIIPDMEGKIAEAKTRYAHCIPDHFFAPLEASITELRVLRHELASPPPVGEAVATCICGDEDCRLWLEHGYGDSPATPQSQDEGLRAALRLVARECDRSNSLANIKALALEGLDPSLGGALSKPTPVEAGLREALERIAAFQLKDDFSGTRNWYAKGWNAAGTCARDIALAALSETLPQEPRT